MKTKKDGSYHMNNAAWKGAEAIATLRDKMIPQQNRVLKLIFFPPPQAEVLSRNQRYLWGGVDRESGSLGFCGAFTEVILQLFQVSALTCGCTYSICSYMCAQKHFKKVIQIVYKTLNTGTEGHSQQNICKLCPRLDFDKHIILHIFQFITTLSKWQPGGGWNLCWVCFCKSDIFILTLKRIIWGRKNSLTSDRKFKGYCGSKKSVYMLHASNVKK